MIYAVGATGFLENFHDRGDFCGPPGYLIGFVNSRGTRNGCFCYSDRMKLVNDLIALEEGFEREEISEVRFWKKARRGKVGFLDESR